MKKTRIGLVVILGAGVLYLALTMAMGEAARRVLVSIEHQMPEGYKMSHGAIETGKWVPEIVVHDVAVTAGDAKVFTAAVMKVRGWPEIGHSGARIWSLDMTDMKWDRTFTASAATLHLTRPGIEVIGSVLAAAKPLDNATLSFADGQITGLTLANADKKLSGTVQTIKLGMALDGWISFVSLQEASAQIESTEIPFRKATVKEMTLQRVPLVSFVSIMNPDPMYWMSRPIDGVKALDFSAETSDGAGSLVFSSLVVDEVTKSEDGIPVSGHLKLSGLGFVPVKEGGDAFSSTEVEMRAKVDPAKKVFALEQFSIASPENCEVQMRMNLSAIPWPPSRAADVTQWIGASVSNLEFSYRDLGFTRRRVEAEAKTRGVSSADLAAEMHTKLLATGAFEGARLSQVAAELSKFIESPTKISVVARPEKPVLLMQLLMASRNPEPVAEALNLFVSTQ